MNQSELDQIIEKLTNRRPLQSLSPQKVWDASIDEQINAIDNKELLALGNSSREVDIEALKSGLLLWNDNLDSSHTLSQDINNVTGSYLHAIMHRMEGDYSNSKYWFRLAGDHPAMVKLHQDAVTWLNEEGRLDSLPAGKEKDKLQAIATSTNWEPDHFVVVVASAASGTPNRLLQNMLEQLQYFEMASLISYCRAAVIA
ncbi:hypothetical protein EBB07_20225 [Paenibacillaceae bacterium]|nr:hypothetical protein EBB07_20225 [Paenibacillaceae bacterium]